MVVYRPIKEERRVSKARTTESAYTSERTVNSDNDFRPRLTPTHYIQLALCRV